MNYISIFNGTAMNKKRHRCAVPDHCSMLDAQCLLLLPKAMRDG